MKYLTYNEIMAEAGKCKNGCITRVGYSKELKMLKGWKELGYRAYKLTETSVRLGVNYFNIAAVIAKKADEEGKPKKERVNNYSWVLPNKVKYNSNTGKTYLQVATLNHGHNTKNQFLVFNPYEGWLVLEKDEWELSEYFMMLEASSKERNKGDKPDVYTITFDNIFRLGKTQA